MIAVALLFILVLRLVLRIHHVIHQNEPPFTFASTDLHEGMPNTFDFKWVVTQGGVVGGGQGKAQGSGPASWGCQCQNNGGQGGQALIVVQSVS